MQGPYCKPGKCFTEYFADLATGIPSDYVLMVSTPPSADHVAQADGTWVLPSVEEMITRTCTRIDTLTESKLRAGFTWGEKTFQNDQTSLIRIAGAALLATRAQIGGDTTWSKDWIVADNSVVSLSAADMVEVGEAATLHEQAVVYAGAAHKTAVRNLATSEDVAAYDYTTGW